MLSAWWHKLLDLGMVKALAALVVSGSLSRSRTDGDSATNSGVEQGRNNLSMAALILHKKVRVEFFQARQNCGLTSVILGPGEAFIAPFGMFQPTSQMYRHKSGQSKSSTGGTYALSHTTKGGFDESVGTTTNDPS
jgi:hypothetical protein